MRLPNGYGSIYKMKGNRRNPWRVRITIGYTDEGKQIYKTLGYYKNRKLALDALSQFHENPSLINASNISFKEIYDKIYSSKISKLSDSSIKAYELSYAYCKKLHDIRFVDIKTDALNDVLNNIDKHGIKRKIKTLFNQMFDYAMQNDIVNKNYSQYVTVGRNTNKNIKTPFSNKEIKLLFENISNFEFIDTILIMIYTGFRIGELLDLKKDNVNLTEKYITGGNKTEAGKDRLVPIHPKVYNLIKNRYENAFEYLVTNKNKKKKLNYRTYKDSFNLVMENLGMQHNPHECRHTFATLMDNANANERAITRIIGHNSFLTTEKFYTHKDIDELRKAIELIK